jgi:hypothetical protein
MERCPNCGQESRVGAKFCTTCGYKMSAADGEPEPAEVTASHTQGENSTVAGWPSSAPTTETATYAAWAPSAATASGSTESTGDEATAEELPAVWSSESGSTWPATSNGTPAATDDEAEEAPANTPTEDIDELTETAEDDAELAATKDRVTRLLDELRDAIATLEGQPAIDLSPVIADLEVAVTPPGAIKPEELSELRDALLAARERPRDIDTIVALTGRLDSLVALIFAYDRTIAAIERSLETLRRA